jgi:hypothetical protein
MFVRDHSHFVMSRTMALANCRQTNQTVGEQKFEIFRLYRGNGTYWEKGQKQRRIWRKLKTQLLSGTYWKMILVTCTVFVNLSQRILQNYTHRSTMFNKLECLQYVVADKFSLQYVVDNFKLVDTKCSFQRKHGSFCSPLLARLKLVLEPTRLSNNGCQEILPWGQSGRNVKQTINWLTFN